MRRDTSQDPRDLRRPEGNDLETNYTKHDIGQAYVKSVLEQHGLQADEWGIDMRDDDGDGLVFDDKMDLMVYDMSQTRLDGERGVMQAIVEVKVKTSEYWMMKLNHRHWLHYIDIAAEQDVPVFVVFLLVDDENEAVEETAWVRVDESDALHHFRFPDGNGGVKVQQTHSEKSALQEIQQT